MEILQVRHVIGQVAGDGDFVDSHGEWVREFGFNDFIFLDLADLIHQVR